MLVVNVNAGSFNLIGRPLGMGAVKVDERILVVSFVVGDVNKIMAGNRVQKRARALAYGLVNSTTGTENQRKKGQSPQRHGKQPDKSRHGKGQSGFHCYSLFILSRVVRS